MKSATSRLDGLNNSRRDTRGSGGVTGTCPVSGISYPHVPGTDYSGGPSAHLGRAPTSDSAWPDVSEVCHLCDAVATGFAVIGLDRYCHGDNDLKPTCYERAQAQLAGRRESGGS